MIKSMTGYGKGEAASSAGNFTVEIRSVNHRYGEISVRLPRSLFAFENEIKRMAAAVLKRGKIEISVQLTETVSANITPQLDMGLARAYFEVYTQLAKELNLPQDAAPSFIMSQKGVLKELASSVDEAVLKPDLFIAINKAIAALDEMRICEGASLEADLVGRRKQITEWTAEIEARSPQMVIENRQKLKIRLDQLLDGAEIEESRLAQEIAILSDRSDITEELVRLASHFKQFDAALKSLEPVGRKLDFLMQEMNREVNTIGSKSNDSKITALVIHIKAEMEKMREQVQNIE
ncbi:MAG: YicC family protein [Desulfuromonadaceae bacterium]|nr:YicC family protein [Desulfuromonadaceae bacterium]MDD2855603.1 YicC family protein [Desulfuromonadaceae bacterium]